MLKILLVEDSSLVSNRIVELICNTPGLEMLEVVTTETAALQEIRQRLPDVVVLDLRLKEGTGFGVLRSLKSDTRPLPTFIVITNYALPQYRTEAKHLGARYFLDKTQLFDELPPILLKLRDDKTSAPSLHLQDG